MNSNAREFGLTVDDRTAIFVEADMYNAGRDRKSFTAWLLVDAKPVSMIRYLVGGENNFPVICDIEVRKEERGNKLGSHFINLVKERLVGEEVYTSGHFTPEGFRSLSETIFVHPKAAEWGDKAEVSFGSMNFVHDWDKFQLEH